MRKTSWLAITLAASAVAPVTVATLTIVQPAWAQVVRNDDVAGAMNRARGQLEPIRKRLERAERSGQIEDRTAALADMKRVLDDVAPIVESMAGDVEMQRAVHREFDRWMADYTAANESTSADTGDFFLMMSERWKELSARIQNYADETSPAKFDDLVADGSIQGFGMPKTLAAARALDTYLIEIESNVDYAKNRMNQNVASDLANARQARAQAVAKLADGAKTVLDQAMVQDLSDEGRARVRTMIENDIPYALAGSPRVEEVQARARAIYSKGAPQQAEGGFDAHGFLSEVADKTWPIYAGRYVTVSNQPMSAGRGAMVEFRDARVIPSDQLGRTDADLVLLVEGRPVICVFDPVVKQHVANIMKETNLETLPEQGVTVIGIVRGLGSVNLIRQPGSTAATTNPSGSEGESTAQSAATLERRDGVAIDVLAIHAGPVAIGVDPTPAQVQTAP